jgi:hypothetical protein
MLLVGLMPKPHVRDSSRYSLRLLSWMEKKPRLKQCPFRKLNPTVLMVKSAQDVARDDAAAALNGSAMWGIFL